MVLKYVHLGLMNCKLPVNLILTFLFHLLNTWQHLLSTTRASFNVTIIGCQIWACFKMSCKLNQMTHNE